MLIAFDCRIIRDKNPAGISWVVLETLKKILSIDRKNEYLLIFDSLDIQEYVKHYIRHIKRPYRTKMLSFNIMSIKNILSLPDILDKENIDIYYIPYYFTSPFHKNSYKVIISVFDLIHFLYPSLKMGLPRKLFHFFRLAPYLVFRRADKIITISVNTSRDLIRMFRVPNKKIKMIYVGVAERYRKIEKNQSLRLMMDKYGVDKPYILYVGRNEPHKNLKALIGAYAKLPPSLRDRFYLVLAGKEDEKYAESNRDFIDKLGIKDRVVFTGYVDDSIQPYVYSGATLFVFPSFYEGFGMPVLEAMACGVPVICSNSSSLPEVGGSAAIYFDPSNFMELNHAMLDILSDHNLREEMIKKGYYQSKRFSWFSAISDLVKCFEEVANIK